MTAAFADCGRVPAIPKRFAEIAAFWMGLEIRRSASEAIDCSSRDEAKMHHPTFPGVQIEDNDHG